MKPPELCGAETYDDAVMHSADHGKPIVCNRTADPQPDGRRHRGRHWRRTATWGYAWNNRPPRKPGHVGRPDVIRTLLIGRSTTVFGYARTHGLPMAWPMIPVHSAAKLHGIVGDLKIIYMTDYQELKDWAAITEAVAALKRDPHRAVTVAYAGPHVPQQRPRAPYDRGIRVAR